MDRKKAQQQGRYQVDQRRDHGIGCKETRQERNAAHGAHDDGAHDASRLHKVLHRLPERPRAGRTSLLLRNGRQEALRRQRQGIGNGTQAVKKTDNHLLGGHADGAQRAAHHVAHGNVARHATNLRARHWQHIRGKLVNGFARRKLQQLALALQFALEEIADRKGRFRLLLLLLFWLWLLLLLGVAATGSE